MHAQVIRAFDPRGLEAFPFRLVGTAIDAWGGKNFNSIHKNESTLPWKCLVSCPMAWYSLEAMAESMSRPPMSQVTPLFDPVSCYNETVPIVLGGDSGAVVLRENERGGSLISIEVDEDREIDRSVGRVEPAGRSDFMERYHRDIGLPKAAAVIEVQGPERA